MNGVNLKTAYLKLKANDNLKFSIQLSYNDFNSEPFVSIESYIDRVVLDYVEEHGLIITIMTPETVLSFSEKNWIPHVGKDYVSFGSTHDDETHCIIELC